MKHIIITVGLLIASLAQADLSGCSRNTEGRVELFSGCDNHMYNEGKALEGGIGKKDSQNSQFETDKGVYFTYKEKNNVSPSEEREAADIFDLADENGGKKNINNDKQTDAIWAPEKSPTADPDQVNTIKEAEDLFKEMADENDTDELENIDDLQKKLEEELPLIAALMVIIKIFNAITDGPGAALDGLMSLLGSGPGKTAHEVIEKAKQLTQKVNAAVITARASGSAGVVAEKAQEQANAAAANAALNPTSENIAEAERLAVIASEAQTNADDAETAAQEAEDEVVEHIRTSPGLQNRSAVEAEVKHHIELSRQAAVIEAETRVANGQQVFYKQKAQDRKIKTISQQKPKQKLLAKKSTQQAKAAAGSGGDGSGTPDSGSKTGSGLSGNFNKISSFNPADYFKGSYDTDTFWQVAKETNRSRSKVRDEPDDGLLGVTDAVISGDFDGAFDWFRKNW